MCLGVPGRVVEVFDDRGVLMGTLDFGGVSKTICLALTPEVTVGEYAIVHAGIAISILDEAAAEATLQLFDDIDADTDGDVVRIEETDESPGASAG